MKPNAITSCQSKKRYDGEAEAEQTAMYLYTYKAVVVKSYHCTVCLGWHLTRRGTV
jgi:hypothetical protein